MDTKSEDLPRALKEYDKQIKQVSDNKAYNQSLFLDWIGRRILPLSRTHYKEISMYLGLKQVQSGNGDSYQQSVQGSFNHRQLLG